MPLADVGWKPAARSAATRIWMQAAAAGEARIAALRAPDFYGPGVGNSYLGDTSIGKLARGKPAVFIGSPDVLHDYAYVVPHCPSGGNAARCARQRLRPSLACPVRADSHQADILKIAADTLGVKLRISALPAWMLGASAMFSPFLVSRRNALPGTGPTALNSSRFAGPFWSDATPFETGVRETALAFRAALKRRR